MRINLLLSLNGVSFQNLLWLLPLASCQYGEDFFSQSGFDIVYNKVKRINMFQMRVAKYFNNYVVPVYHTAIKPYP